MIRNKIPTKPETYWLAFGNLNKNSFDFFFGLYVLIFWYSSVVIQETKKFHKEKNNEQNQKILIDENLIFQAINAFVTS